MDTTKVGQTILAQTIVVANQAAASAAEAAAYAAELADKAPLDSPHFVGIPTAPTAAPGTNSTQIATTEYLDRLLAAPNGIATLDSSGLIPSSQLPSLALTEVYTVNSQAAMLALPAEPGDLAVRTDINETFILSASPASTLANWTQLLFAAPVTSVAGLVGDISGPDLMTALSAAPLASPTFTGTPAAPTPGSNVNTTQIPTTAWVNSYFATLASPTLTGMPAAPTASPGTNTGQIATTAFVLAQIAATSIVSSFNGRTGTVSPQSGDYVVGDVTGAAPLASPSFTGTPSLPTGTTGVTQSPGDNTTKLATTEFVTAAVIAAGSVTSVFGRTGAVTAQTGDYTVSQITGAAPLASPTFTGAPSLPTGTTGVTQSASDNSTKLATTAYADNAAAGSAVPTGTMRPTLQSSAASGWLLMDDGSIGSGSSGATYANTAAQALFTLIFNNTTDANCAIQTSAGAGTTRAAQTDAATAWANNCRIFLPKILGRAAAGAGAGSGLTSRALGQTVGEEAHTLTSAQQASMPVSVSGTGTLPYGSDSSGSTYISRLSQTLLTNWSISVSATGTATGGGGAHNNMQPTTFFNWEIKL